VDNSFTKQEKVMFELLLAAYEDAQVLAKKVRKWRMDQTEAARSNDTFWRPQPYIMQSFLGADQTLNFNPATQLAVPATINIRRSVPFVLSDIELRDALQEERLGKGAEQRLASDINLSILNAASLLGTNFIQQTGAATGFADLTAISAMMDQVGVPMDGRCAMFSPKDYNNAAGNLAARQFVQGKALTAYERADLGEVAGFDLLKSDYAIKLAAASGGAITIATDGSVAANWWIPQARSTAASGESANVDNRFQTVTVSATANVRPGDAFTIAGVNAVHMITKQDAGFLKTFRVVSVTDSTHMVITPPIITPQTGYQSTQQYQNVNLASTSSTASITWLNTSASYINPVWHEDALELLPGKIMIPSNAGLAVLRGTTDSGMELVLMKQGVIDTGEVKYRVDTLYGVVNKMPEMSGALTFTA
jgi:hypothetical protein